MTKGPYNPLDKLNLAKSIEAEILSGSAVPLGSLPLIKGAGVYAIYYAGDFSPYASLSALNKDGQFVAPIYVGKAIPKGGRKGGLTADATKGKALSDRLGQHASSIDEAVNLKLEHFFVRHLVVDDVWIPLGENMLIDKFRPIWNRAIDGFGNKDPGKRRSKQFRSPWDVIHPGRKFADKLADGGVTVEFLEKRIEDYLAGRPLDPLPKKVAEEIADEVEEAEDAADKV